jgi:hypothetical protein
VLAVDFETSWRIAMRTVISRALRILSHPITATVLALVAAFALAWLWPKTVATPGIMAVAHYRGFLAAGSGILGPRYFRITGLGGYDIQYSGPGYNSFEFRDPDVEFFAIGTCRVELRGPDSIPVPDINNIENAVFYKPDGSVGSEIRNGTGFFTMWHSNSKKVIETEFRDSQQVRSRIWYGNGQLASDYSTMPNGREHGLYTLHFANGSKAKEGVYDNGVKTGAWTYYRPDGTIEKIEQYDRGKLIRTEIRESQPDQPAKSVEAAPVPENTK